MSAMRRNRGGSPSNSASAALQWSPRLRSIRRRNRSRSCDLPMPGGGSAGSTMARTSRAEAPCWRNRREPSDRPVRPGVACAEGSRIRTRTALTCVIRPLVSVLFSPWPILLCRSREWAARPPAEGLGPGSRNGEAGPKKVLAYPEMRLYNRRPGRCRRGRGIGVSSVPSRM